MPSDSEIYDFFNRYVQPRPVFIVCTLNEDESPNVALFSHVTPVGSNPPTIAFCPSRDDSGREKTSLLNAQRSQEFVACVATRDLIQKLRLNEPIAHINSSRVHPPRIAGSPFSMECKLAQFAGLGLGPHGANVVIGHVIEVHQDETTESVAGTIGSGRYIELSTFSTFEI